jgi:glycosyltransferase involved in cell wall biosynthesis
VILLSVIVPVRDMAGRLQNLRSWLADVGNKPMEVIIIHDFSDQATEVELNEINKEFSSVKMTIITERLHSPGLARNLGMGVAVGKFISFWDSDDAPRVGIVISELENLPMDVEVIIGQFEVVDIAEPEFCLFTSTDNKLLDMALNPGIWRMAFKSDILAESRFSKHKMGEDQEFLAKVLSTSENVKFSNQIWYTYFTNNPDQLTKNESAIRELLEVIPLATEHQKGARSEILPVLMVMQIRKILTLFKTFPALGMKSFFMYFSKSFQLGGIRAIPKLVWAFGNTVRNSARGRL